MQKKECCTVCGKKVKDIKVLTEVSLEVYPRYIREDGVQESMNGLWKKTSEFFCDECFDKYTKILESFYKKNSKKKK